MLTNADIVEEIVRFEGGGRALEGVLAYPADQPRFSALIVGPHPLLGGDLRNNVVIALLRGLAADGAAALAFNYAGVGSSEGGPADWPAVTSAFWKDGTFAEEIDWADDASAAVSQLRRWRGGPLVLVGYSFGCWAIAKDLEKACPTAIVLISPNPKQHAFHQLPGCVAPLLVIHSDNDFTCDVTETIAWFDSIREPKTRVQLSAGEHFFRGHEEAVASTVVAFLRKVGISRVE